MSSARLIASSISDTSSALTPQERDKPDMHVNATHTQCRSLVQRTRTLYVSALTMTGDARHRGVCKMYAQKRERAC